MDTFASITLARECAACAGCCWENTRWSMYVCVDLGRQCLISGCVPSLGTLLDMMRVCDLVGVHKVVRV